MQMISTFPAPGGIGSFTYKFFQGGCMSFFQKRFPLIALFAALGFSGLYGTTDEVLSMHNGESIGDVTLSKETMFTDARGVARAFYINVLKNSKYFISVVTNCCAGSEYDVTLDNQNFIEGKIILADGWKASFVVDKGNRYASKAIRLSNGEHRVSIIGKGPEVPSIERIRIAETESSALVSADDIIAQAKEIAAQPLPAGAAGKKAEGAALKAAAATASAMDPKYAYAGQTNMPLVYSYFFTMSLTGGVQYTFETRNCGTGDPVLFIFLGSLPSQYSWSNDDFAPPDRNAKLIFTPPMSVTYYGVLASYGGGAAGTCDLYRNGTRIASSVQFGGSIMYCGSINSAMATVNCFTAKPAINPVANRTYDTRLFMLGGIASPVIEYNDDYAGTGDYQWGTLSRINKAYVTEPQYALVVQKNTGYPGNTIDCYAKCGSAVSLKHDQAYGNYKDDDAIKSGEADGSYNCHAWAGGVTSYWFNGGPVATMDQFYANTLPGYNPRYAGAENFTRTGATLVNEAIVCWSSDGTGNGITHSSVRKPANGQMHGYQWESKCGGNLRCFHPRNAMHGSYPLVGYGEIYCSYKSTGTFASTAKMAALNITSPLTLDESIKLNLTKFEEVSVTAVEQARIDNLIAGVPAAAAGEFAEKFEKWRDTWNRAPLCYSSASRDYAQSNEYRSLLDFCRKQGKTILPLLCNTLQKAKHGAAGVILEDLLGGRHAALMKEVDFENESTKFTPDGTLIIRSGQGNMRKLCRKVLAAEFN
jgi:hypothetical protein